MKKILVLIAVIVLGLTALYVRGIRLVSESMPHDALFVFSQKGCHHCQSALAFIDERIRPKYPNLRIEVLDVAQRDNSFKLSIVAQQYNLGSHIGTPVLIVNGRALMGWNSKNERKLLSLIKTIPTKKP